MSAKDIPMRPTNHKTIYTQPKYTQTPDPPPCSGRLVSRVSNRALHTNYIALAIDPFMGRARPRPRPMTGSIARAV